ncbi:AAA family ATPase [Nakamurella deserti]|uniref:AAA family ATPase n=1 Tax=Nakamurella deserti TaxID=2164074 RepID=UPI000DBE1D3F|nr:AAA family ATPase [Nakamurella deserti]
MAETFEHDLRQLIRARFPLLYLQTPEETRALQAVVAAVADPSVRRREIYTWTFTNGLALLGDAGSPETRNPGSALAAAAKLDLASVVVFFDLHPWLGTANQPADPQLVRQLRDLARQYRDGGQPRMLILVSPVLRIPTELENTVTVVDFPLPDQARLRELLVGMIEANRASKSVTIDLGDGPDAVIDALARGALGLTLAEAENAFARAMADDNRLDTDDIPVVLNEKRQIIRRSGVLEVVTSTLALSDIGGLANLKAWLVKRTGAWTADAARYGLPAPKGALVTGVPGCGKSMTAKAMASAWSIPLIRLDIGKIFAGLVGASEENMRKALDTAEAIAPCVLWIDEIEKGFASASGERDSGTSARVFGSFLTWMQERVEPVFVIATANDISRLPPEFMRKGRFDEIFFIDLPTRAERVDIFGLHLRLRLAAGPDLGAFDVGDALLAELADATEGFTGSEIEQAVVSACFDAFDGRRPLAVDDLRHAIATTVPLSVTQAEDIAALRSWASLRAVSASTVADRTGYTVVPPATAPVTDPAAALQRGGRPVEV